MTASPPQLKWKELCDFPGEWQARVGDLVFSVSATHYYIDAKNGEKLLPVVSGSKRCLHAAKQACQAFLNRIYRDLKRME